MKPALHLDDAADPTWPADTPDTPAERRKRRIRDSIIEAAEQVFAEEGEAGLSMRRLAEKIDYSPAAIYKYFSSKDELLATIREQFFERLMVRLQETAAPGRSEKDGFLDGMRAYVQTGIDSPNHYRMAFVNFGTAEPPEGTLQYEAAVRYNEQIRAHIDSGLFREVDPVLAAKSLLASIHGLTSLMASNPDFPCCLGDDTTHLTREAMIEFHIQQVFEGLARR